MKRAPVGYRPPRWSQEELEHLRAVERDFHVRAFGEELARVNLDMSLAARRAYLQWMRDYARRRGIRFCPESAGR